MGSELDRHTKAFGVVEILDYQIFLLRKSISTKKRLSKEQNVRVSRDSEKKKGRDAGEGTGN